MARFAYPKLALASASFVLGLFAVSCSEESGESPDPDPECLAGFDPVETEDDCHADVGCYEHEEGHWCTGACPSGQQLSTEGDPACEPIEQVSCPIDGFEPQEGCPDDGSACFDYQGATCVGQCPDGESLGEPDETGVPRCEPDPTPVCIDGFELDEEIADCEGTSLECYEVEEGFCVGECPDGHQMLEVDEDGGAACREIQACAEGYEEIASEDECLADLDCYEGFEGAWCTGECPEGQSLSEDSVRVCVDDPACPLEGFERVEAAEACEEGAICIEHEGAWCTGACDEAEVLTIADDGTWACAPADDAACPDGFAHVSAGQCGSEEDCVALDDGTYCTGACPEGSVLDETGEAPVCVAPA